MANCFTVNKLQVSEVSFHYAHYCIDFQNRKETYCSVDTFFLNVQSLIFYFLYCKGIFSRERGNEGLSCVAGEFSV